MRIVRNRWQSFTAQSARIPVMAAASCCVRHVVRFCTGELPGGDMSYRVGNLTHDRGVMFWREDCKLS